MAVHLPVLRQGRPYRSLDTITTPHYRTREPFVTISLANVGLIRRDLLNQDVSRKALAARPIEELIAISKRAADLFLHDTLPIDPLDGVMQSPQEYVTQVSATTGLPHVLVRRNMHRIAGVLAKVDEVLTGLTRGLDLRLLDRGMGMDAGRPLSFFPRAQTLGVVLPSNSPGVHSLWVPTIALKVGLTLKPGSAEPWSPARIAQALIKAGCPPEAFGYYPCEHAGGAEILRQCGRGMVFGDTSTMARWANDSRVERHGPGYSKVVIGEDLIDQWEQYIDVIAASIAENSGRSCVNASGVWVPRHGDAIAEALADRLLAVVPRAEDDDRAELAPFADPNVATRISSLVDQALAEEGARDVSTERRGSSRVADWNGCRYLLPTIIRCKEASHGLANREFLFPFASVVEAPQSAMPEVLGPSLVVSAITHDPRFIDDLVMSPLVDRLNIGAIKTNQLIFDQPHEGNLFEHLYGRRSIQQSA